MRKRIFIVATVTAIALTGCASVPTLSEQQNDAIAEYIADNLLRYDKNYISAVKLNNDLETAEPTATPYIESTVAPMTSGTPVVSGTNETEKPYNPLESGEPKTSAEPEQTYVSLSEAMNIPGFTAKVSGYKCGFEINTRDSNISAHKGKKLMVFNIKLKNNTSSKKKVDMTKNSSLFKLSVNGKSMDSALLTIAGEDIHFMKKKVAPGKSLKTILVFEIPSNTKIKDVILEVTNKDAVAQVNVK